MARGLKMFVRFSFGLKQEKSSKKVQQELFTRKKNAETGTKRALDYFRMPKLQEIFTTRQLPSCFIAMRDSPFRKCFRHYPALSKGKR